MSFDPNILGAFVIGGLLTYIAKNNSYFESEDSPQAIQYTPAPTQSQVAPRTAQYAPQAIQSTPAPKAQSQVAPRNAQVAPRNAQVPPVSTAQSQITQSQVTQSQVAQSQVAQSQVAPRNAQVLPVSTAQSQVAPRTAQVSQSQVAQSQVAQSQITQSQVSQSQVAPRNVPVPTQSQVAPQNRRVGPRNRIFVSIKDVLERANDTNTYLSKFTIKELENKDTEGVGYYRVDKGDFLWSLAHILSNTPQEYYTENLKKYKDELKSEYLFGFKLPTDLNDESFIKKTLKTIPLTKGLIILPINIGFYWDKIAKLNFSEPGFYIRPLTTETPYIVNLRSNGYYPGKGPLPQELINELENTYEDIT